MVILEDGTIQIVGKADSFKVFIDIMRQAIPELTKQEKDRVLKELAGQLTPEEVKNLVAVEEK